MAEKKYIEREAALSAVDCGNLHKGIVDALHENIKDIPAADVVEVRHGRWIVRIDDPVGTVCSECGFSWSRAINAVTLNPALSNIQTRYCPNCGARMDGGADDAAD